MPVVVITALSPDEFSVVADVVRQKPVDYPVLLSTVRRLMSPDERRHEAASNARDRRSTQP